METEVRAAVYLRVSTEEQRDGTSLDVQRQTCLNHVDGKGWAHVGSFADEGVSGAISSRPALDELIAACKRGEVDVVVVSRLDRFGRSLRHLTATLGILDDLGVEFVSVHEAFDSVGPAGRLQRNILSSVAQFEREQMLDRSRSGSRAIVEAGWWPGGPTPFGFGLERVGRHLRLVIHEPEAAAIRKAVDLIVDEGFSPRRAADELNRLGFPPRKTAQWQYSNLRSHLLTAPISGTWRYGRGRGPARKTSVIQVTIPAIISPERHLAVVEVLRRTSFGPQHPTYESYYVLSRGMLRCVCGAPCTGETNQLSGRRTYKCAQARYGKEPRCDTPRIYGPSIEDFVMSGVAAVLDAVVDGEIRAAPSGVTQRLAVLGERITETEVAVGRVAIALLGLDLSKEAMTVIMAELTTGLALLRREKERMESLLVNMAADPARTQRLREIAQSVGGRLTQLPPWKQRPILEMLDVHVGISGWETCGRCQGRRRVSGDGKAASCPECFAVGQTPQVRITGIWIEGN